MLYIYFIKVLIYVFVKKMKEENWVMDGFVSLIFWKFVVDFNNKFVFSLLLKF